MEKPMETPEKSIEKPMEIPENLQEIDSDSEMEIITIKRKKFTEIERVAYNIAKKHLGSSFDYSKCSGSS